jgi:hypothetical protein
MEPGSALSREHDQPTLATFLLIPGPAFVIAALFLTNWLKRGELHATRA